MTEVSAAEVAATRAAVKMAFLLHWQRGRGLVGGEDRGGKGGGVQKSAKVSVP